MTPEQIIEMLASLAIIAKMLDRLSWFFMIFVFAFMMCSFLRAMCSK